MARRGSNYSGGDAYRRMNAKRRLAKTSPDHRSPAKSLRDYASIPHPKGSPWANRVRVVIGDNPVCWLCGVPIPRGEAVADHVIPLTEGQGLSIATDDMRHPLNSRLNLRASHKSCNNWRGQLSPEAGRRKVAERLGLPAPYSGPVPDVSGVRAELARLVAESAPDAAAGRAEPATPPCPYKTVQEAIDDLESTPGKADLARDDAADVWAWQEAGLLSCKCGPATGEESAACWLCNPVISPWRG